MNPAASRDKIHARSFLGARAAVLSALVAALIGACFFREFAVDDALISVRYARNVANGAGWRFDVAGGPTDGVTPLPWPVLLGLAAKACGATRSAWRTFVVARALGVLAHAATVIVAVRAIAAAKPSRDIWTIVVLALLLGLPASAYAASGMETPIAALFATLGAVGPFAIARPDVAALLVGLAAAFRPELAPWAMSVALGYGRRPRSLLLAVAPAAACAAIRFVAFGSPAPLAVLAKPSDFGSGLSYVAASLAISTVPLLLFAPRALARRDARGAGAALSDFARARVVAAALVVHAAAVVFVGGDWMPFARLFAPVLPASLVAFVWLAPQASRAWTNVRAAIALILAAGGAYAGRGYVHLLPERIALAEAARPYLAPARRVATVDIGWPTLATEADFVDLAGLTDPGIAGLPGGHTSKRVDAVLLLNRAPDVVLLYTDDGAADRLDAWSGFHYPRAVEARLAADPRFTKRVEPVAYVANGSAGYVVLRVFP